MNICPHCGAELGDSARFCIACMTPLNQKRVILTSKSCVRRWLPVAAAVLVFVLAVGAVVWLMLPKGAASVEQTSASVATQPDRTPDFVKGTTDSGNVTPNDSTTTDGDILVNSTTTGVGTDSDTTAGDSTTISSSTSADGYATANGSGTISSGTTSGDVSKTDPSTKTESATKTGSATKTESATKTGSSTKAESTTKKGSTTKRGSTTKKESTTKVSEIIKTSSTGANSSTKTSTSTTNSINAVTYLYRDARAGDDFAVFANLENAVVITGVSNPAPDGVYIIPETLGGKRVVAIMGNAFCSNDIKNSVRTVVVPATVRTIWNYAFATCYYLTDIYFLGDAVYTESNAFADPAKRMGTLTIHCSAVCSDRSFRYYKDAAPHYHAQYKELSDTDYASMKSKGRLSIEDKVTYRGGDL